MKAGLSSVHLIYSELCMKQSLRAFQKVSLFYCWAVWKRIKAAAGECQASLKTKINANKKTGHRKKRPFKEYPPVRPACSPGFICCIKKCYVRNIQDDVLIEGDFSKGFAAVNVVNWMQQNNEMLWKDLKRALRP